MSSSAVPSGLPPAGTLEWLTIDGDTDEAMRAVGKHRLRTIVALRRALPLDDTAREGIPAITTRPFDPGRDTDELLEVNNAAFAWHPDQGGWDRGRLAEAMSQRWVDPSGILVHAGTDGTLDGFCWTRVHDEFEPEVIAAGDPPLGEIWVIAAHPDSQGSRLGPALVAAGLDHLAEQGLGTAVLYTEEANEPARRMYERMGFHLHERRGGYS